MFGIPDEPPKDDPVKKAFARMSRNALLRSLLMIAGLVVYSLAYPSPRAGEVDPIYVLLVWMAAFMTLQFIYWRCPACRKVIPYRRSGTGGWCKSCGVEFY